MAMRENRSFNLPLHRGEHGNLKLFPARMEIPNGWAAGDVVDLLRIPRAHECWRLDVRTDGATGLTLDVGIRGADTGPSGAVMPDVQQSTTDDPTYFAADIDVGSPGTQALITGAPKIVESSDGWNLPHILTATLKGTVSAGDVVWFEWVGLSEGAP